MSKPTFYSAVLWGTIFAFLMKGVSYIFLESYIPVILASIILAILALLQNKPKASRTFIKLWSLALILWALARLLILSLDTFIKPLMEFHLQQELGGSGILISLIFLGLGVFLWRGKKNFSKP